MDCNNCPLADNGIGIIKATAGEDERHALFAVNKVLTVAVVVDKVGDESH